MSSVLDKVLHALMENYKKQVPDVSRIFDLMIQHGLIHSLEDIENDHIAFRTLGLPCLGIASLEKIFLSCGYERKDPYTFEKKKLKAFWYAPPDPKYPRIFISELEVPKLSSRAQKIIHHYTAGITCDPVENLDLKDGEKLGAFLHSPLWPAPTLEDYEYLEQESEYASWVIYNRFYLNHFTISVHNLLKHNTLESFIGFLESHGLVINTAGGKVKISEDQLLLQGSTVAAKSQVEFTTQKGGVERREVATSYVEFAERKVFAEHQHLDTKDIKRHHRRDGFETQNADGIFESTYRNQTKKR